MHHVREKPIVEVFLLLYVYEWLYPNMSCLHFTSQQNCVSTPPLEEPRGHKSNGMGETNLFLFLFFFDKIN